MAENLTRALYGKQVYARSAGVNAGDPDPFVPVVMAERGIAMDNQQPVTLDELGDGYFDLVITLSPEAHHHVLLEHLAAVVVLLAGTAAVVRFRSNDMEDNGRWMVRHCFLPFYQLTVVR